jgi:hypothetical protein
LLHNYGRLLDRRACVDEGVVRVVEVPNEVGPPHHAPVANTAAVVALVLVVVPAIVEVDGARRHAALQPWPLVKVRHFVAVDGDGRGHRALLRHVAGRHA